ncbi:MAG: biopolymer transporter ExbD [Deltaproteobacteria bacterium]|nr:biopolymer transporter ExbD [Deltaproteobacteria bacterium]
MRAPSIVLPGLSLAWLVALAACDSKPSSSVEASATATATSAALPEPAGKRAFSVMPDMVVDERGIGVGPERIDLGTSDGAMKLAETLDRVPVTSKQPTVRTTTKAQLRDVGALVNGLGKRGAATILLKMDGARTDLLGEYVIVPEGRLDKPDDCSVVVSVLEDSSTAVWAYRGGGGKKARKGLSGPDLSVTGDNVGEQLRSCASKTAFFTASPKMRWEHAFHVGALIRKTDAKSVVEQLVLLANEPVAGQPVKLDK